MKKLLTAGILAAGLMLTVTPSIAQESTCITREVIEERIAELEPTVYFEDVDTVVYQSPQTPTMLEVEFDAQGCAASFVEMDSVAVDLKYGEGV